MGEEPSDSAGVRVLLAGATVRSRRLSLLVGALGFAVGRTWDSPWIYKATEPRKGRGQLSANVDTPPRTHYRRGRLVGPD